VRCRLINPAAIEQWIPYPGWLDTGSEDTLFPADLAALVGIDLRNAEGGLSQGVGSHAFAIKYAPVRLRVIDEAQRAAEWTAIVAFTTQQMSYGLLGFAGCLEFFVTTFDGERETFELSPNGLFRPTGHGRTWKITRS